MSFRFSLATVLRLRESLERKEQLSLEKCYQRLASVQHHLQQIDEQLKNWHHDYEKHLLQGTAAVGLHMLIADRESTERLRQETVRQLAEAQEDLKQQMSAYRVARQRREIVSELRKHQMENYRRQEDLQEQKSRDDLFLLRRMRANRQQLPSHN